MEVEREPCPRCSEPVPTEARTCPQCHTGLLVNLALAEAISEERSRYQAARSLAALGPPFPSFLDATHALAIEGSVLATDLTRSRARAYAKLLQNWDIRVRETAGSVETIPTRDPSGRLPSERIADWLGGIRESGSRGLLIGAAALFAALFALWLLLPSGIPARAPGAGKTSAPRAIGLPATSSRRVAEEALASTVALTCGRSSGTGFFVKTDTLLTNNHVLCEDGPIRVRLYDGRELSGSVLRRDDWLDLATVRVPEADAKPLPLGDTTDTGPGDRVFAVGNPLRLEFTVTQGIISHSARNFLGIGYLQFDSSISPGSSGGPLVDEQGQVLGIVSMMISGAAGLGLALPINYAYAGPKRLVPGPDSSSSEKWKAFLSRIRNDDEKEAREADSALSLPGLAAGVVARDAGVVAIVMRRAWSEPLAERFRFRLQRRGEVLCSPSGEVSSWKKADMSQDVFEDSRYVRWLQKHNISFELWGGAARLDWQTCPDAEESLGAELILEGGDPRADGVVLESTE